MAIFGISRKKAQAIVKEAVAFNKKRINQLVGLLMTGLPQTVLDKKINWARVPGYIASEFPHDLVYDEDDDGNSSFRKDVKFNDVLSFIDP